DCLPAAGASVLARAGGRDRLPRGRDRRRRGRGGWQRALACALSDAIGPPVCASRCCCRLGARARRCARRDRARLARPTRTNVTACAARATAERRRRTPKVESSPVAPPPQRVRVSEGAVTEVLERDRHGYVR